MKNNNRSSWIVAGTYLVFSTCWIVFSDLVVEKYFSGFQQLTHAQTIKGLFFIALSTAIILVLSIQLNRKKDSAEGQMRKAKSAFRSLFKKSPIGYSIVDQQGKILESNYRFRKILEIKPEHPDNNIATFLNKEDDDPVLKWMNTPEEKNRSESQMLQRKMKTASGKKIWVQFNISHINEEGQYLISIQDMSSEKEAHHKMFALKTELREIGKAGNIGHWELDPLSGEIILSEEIEFILKPTDGNFSGAKAAFMSLLSEKEAEYVSKALQESKMHKSPLDITFEFQAADKELLYFRLQGNWKSSQKSTQEILTGIIRDITNDIKLLQKKTEYARHLDIWSSAVSHELRGPIATMGGLLNLIRNKKINDEETCKIVTHMKSAYEEMDKITHKFGTELESQKNSL